METLSYPQLHEQLVRHKLKNGLEVHILPKPHFNKTFATFTTKYGSIDNHFKPLNRDEWMEVPDGIAHFLEHKMFEQPDGTDAFQLFNNRGAFSNAMTSFTFTTYLFSSTANVMENLLTLIDFVQTPGFTEESVEREKGIIEQEIHMINDHPDRRLFLNLLGNLYHNHPVKVEIGGTVPSIQKISYELLMDCYRTFYHPSNMLLFVAGPVDPEKVIAEIEKNQNGKGYEDHQPIERKFPEEPAEVNGKVTKAPMAVETPKLLVGFKEAETGRKGRDLLTYQLSVQLVLEMIFGKSGRYYHELMNEGLIDSSFSYDYSEEQSFAFSMIGGNTPNPDRLTERIAEIIKEVKEQAFDQEVLERTRKKMIGQLLRQLNSLENVALEATTYHFNAADMFDLIPVLESIDMETLQKVMRGHFKNEAMAASQIIKK